MNRSSPNNFHKVIEKPGKWRLVSRAKVCLFVKNMKVELLSNKALYRIT